jgi:hypothetical protein
VICPYEHDNELSGFIKGGEIFGQLSDYQFLKDDSASEGIDF